MTSITWVAPAPLWTAPSVGLNGPGFKKPWLAEFEGDTFIPNFLALMGGQAPSDLAQKEPKSRANQLYKLFQPIHGSYYLVTASLICREFGLPDRQVAVAKGERASFVLRRKVTVGSVQQEQGWLKEGSSGSWQPLVDSRGRTLALHPNEDFQPMHPVRTRVPALSGAAPAEAQQRTVYYGYIPVASREKYLQRVADLNSIPLPSSEKDPRLMQVEVRVLHPWQLIFDQKPPLGNSELAQPSLYLILDLMDFLKNVLPDVFQALITGSSLTGAKAALLEELRTIKINDVNNDAKDLYQAMKELVDYLPLVNGLPPALPGLPTHPAFPYDLKQATRLDNTTKKRVAIDEAYLASEPNPGRLNQLIDGAIRQGAQPIEIPPQVADMIKIGDSDTSTPGTSEQAIYYLRLVYQYGDCPPVISELSAPFVFAKFFDPDAPARHIHIELPDIRNMRRFQRGIGMETTPELRNLMDRVHKGLLNGEDLGPQLGWELGMICSFSIQIITLVAFIVMFIFLIALNFIFWWLPFLKICFPIPVKK